MPMYRNVINNHSICFANNRILITYDINWIVMKNTNKSLYSFNYVLLINIVLKTGVTALIFSPRAIFWNTCMSWSVWKLSGTRLHIYHSLYENQNCNCFKLFTIVKFTFIYISQNIFSNAENSFQKYSKLFISQINEH